MDGVLVDARDWHFRALNQALSLFGFEISENDHLATFDGLPTRTKLQILSDTAGLPRGLHGIISELKQDFTMREAYLHCRPEFHIINTLLSLHECGLALGCASNSVRLSVETFLQMSELAPFFSVVLSNEDVQNPKPHPEIYLRGMQLLGFEPEETLIVEDNEHGAQAATASGAHLLKVTSPRDVTADLLHHQIHLIGNRPHD